MIGISRGSGRWGSYLLVVKLELLFNGFDYAAGSSVEVEGLVSRWRSGESVGSRLVAIIEAENP